MSRNGSGTYSTVNTFLAGAVITAAGHNQNWADIATQMTNSVAADGQTSMTGALKASNGTVAAPALTFASDPDTGFYRIGANNIGAAVNGAKALDIAATGVSLLGTTTNDSAATGFVGEYVSSNLPQVSFIALTSGVTVDITSISLTAGDWDVYGSVAVRPPSGSTQIVSQLAGWINTLSATSPDDVGEGGTGILFQPSATSGFNAFSKMPGLRRRILIAVTTTVYLTTNVSFSGGAISAYGFIGARRVR